MKIYLHEITDQETELDFTHDENHEEKWLAQAVQKVDEDTSSGSPSAPKAEPRPVQAHFSLRQVDGVVVVSGSIDTHVQLLCSRCAGGFRFETHPQFSALFCKDPVMAGVGHLQQSGRDKGKPGGQNKGFARHAHDSDSDAASEAGMDLDITYLSQDYIDLGEILTEQLRLQIPFQPLCKETCKGICSNCGADLNVGRCACAKLTTASPFAVLPKVLKGHKGLKLN